MADHEQAVGAGSDDLGLPIPVYIGQGRVVQHRAGAGVGLVVDPIAIGAIENQEAVLGTVPEDFPGAVAGQILGCHAGG